MGAQSRLVCDGRPHAVSVHLCKHTGACEIHTHLGRACLFHVLTSLPLSQCWLEGLRQLLTEISLYFTGQLHSTCSSLGPHVGWVFISQTPVVHMIMLTLRRLHPWKRQQRVASTGVCAKENPWEEDTWEDRLQKHNIRGWRAVDAAVLQGQGSRKRSVFLRHRYLLYEEFIRLAKTRLA